MSLVDLQRAAEFPAQTTLRAHLKQLIGLGALAKHRHNQFPGALEYELTLVGYDLLIVTRTLNRWLGHSPEAPLSVGGSAARAAIKALTEGWSTTMLRALAAEPLSLTELDAVIASLNYPSIERRLTAMRLAGLVAPCEGNGRGTPHVVTDWAREAVAPVAAAANWEQRHAAEAATQITALDVETALLLTVPLLKAERGPSGRCRLGIEFGDQPEQLAGVTVELDAGEIVSCSTQLQEDAAAWVQGAPSAWLSMLVGRRRNHLKVGGNKRLASKLIERLRLEHQVVPLRKLN